VQSSKFSNSKYRRIYLSRANARYRKVVNDLEFISFLEKYGFSCCSNRNLSFVDQVELFRNVEVVIAPHGAGLSNLVFCPRGVKL
jgi:capsular polysaccharide biosynthesis protein